MKKNIFINKEAVKSWKRAAAKGRLYIANKNGKIYIATNYTGFVIPAIAELYDALVLPAVGEPMPNDGQAYRWHSGKFSFENATAMTNRIDDIVKNAKDTAAPTNFSLSLTLADCRIYKTRSGLAAINEAYNSMIDHNQVVSCHMASPIQPAVFKSANDWIAILFPVRVPGIESKVRDLLA